MQAGADGSSGGSSQTATSSAVVATSGGLSCPGGGDDHLDVPSAASSYFYSSTTAADGSVVVGGGSGRQDSLSSCGSLLVPTNSAAFDAASASASPCPDSISGMLDEAAACGSRVAPKHAAAAPGSRSASVYKASFSRDDAGPLVGVKGGLQRDSSTKEADPSGRIFRRGAVYKGIYLPSLSGKLQDDRLEAAYQRYAHRQRQKSLMLVNTADLCLKAMVVMKVLCVVDEGESKVTDQVVEEEAADGLMVTKTCYLVTPYQFTSLLAWLGVAAAINLLLSVVSWWRCYANHFLHWGAIATWMLLLVQGERAIFVRKPRYVV